MENSKVMQRIAAVSNVIGAIALLIMLVVTVADVIMSRIFNSPFPGATEIITSVMPISVFAFLLSTQIKSRHINIDMVLNRLGTKARTLLKMAGQGVGIFLFGLLTKLTVPMAIYSYQITEHTGGSVAVPMYPAKIMIPIATGLITIQLVIELIKSLRVLLGRNGDNEGSLTAS
ncbi:MAG: TRAP transporter small permease subunit [Deltaproteobacteria bacterium]|jgi:TRAP-type mannitol/chloroaromatic compound transport system permease small subunit|nr:TRAP transporter small permease subunit [Deltaproteobacteria bacterium]